MRAVIRSANTINFLGMGGAGQSQLIWKNYLIERMQNSQVSNNGFEPKIVGFLCRWCSYAGADLAGTARLKYPANIRIIRVPCSGRVEPEFVVKALRSGADGVLVLGCHIGDCHYQTGNHRTMKRMSVLRKILGYLGIDPRRVRLEWVSASEAPRFVEVVEQFTAEIKELGPNLLKEVKA